MTTRRAACCCGQLHLAIEGEPSRISAIAWGANAAPARSSATKRGSAASRSPSRAKRPVEAHGRKRQHADFLFLSDVRLHCLLGERRLSGNFPRCHRELRRSEFSGADYRGVGGDASPLGLVATRHSVQANGEAGVITSPPMRFALVKSGRSNEAWPPPQDLKLRGSPV